LTNCRNLLCAYIFISIYFTQNYSKFSFYTFISDIEFWITPAYYFSWLVTHSNAILDPDVKSDNPKTLSVFRAAKYFEKIIPQTYYFTQFLQVMKLGFERIILTTCKTYYSTTSMRRFAEITRFSALTGPVFRLSHNLIYEMIKLNVPIFTHPAPFRSDLEKIPKGVKAIYSATLCE